MQGQNSGHVPQRMCVICRRRFAKGELSRFIRAATGELRPDPEKVGYGRGWYCCPEPDCRAKFANFRPRTKKRSQGEL